MINSCLVNYLSFKLQVSMKKKGKGLSFDQKRQRMLGIFHKTKDVFNFQQIEKLSIKAGIPFPAVKEILDSLKADSLVECQKIGAGVFYWSFPSKSFQIMTNRIQVTEKQCQTLKEQIELMDKSLKQSIIGRQMTQQRAQLEKQINILKATDLDLTGQVQKLIRFDPERVQLLKKQNQQLKNMINASTDNLEQIKKYIKKTQPGITDTDIQNTYQIPVDLDYVQ